MKVALAGAGAFGVKHLEAIAKIDGVEVVSLVGRTLDATREVAASFGVGHVTTELAESLARPGVDAVILCTPTQMHASQAIACLEAGKHVQVEIPLADSLADAEQVVRRQQDTGPRLRWSATRAASTRATSGCTGGSSPASSTVQQMDVQTYFFRRKNINALGEPRSWTDHLLWHHAAHTVDLFPYQTGGDDRRRQRAAGPAASGARHRDGHVDPAEERHRRDLHAVAVVQQRRPARHVLPLHLRQRHLRRALRRSGRRHEEPKIDVSKVDVSMNGIELQDREFFAAIREGREPNASVAQVLPCYRTLDRLERQLAGEAA